MFTQGLPASCPYSVSILFKMRKYLRSFLKHSRALGSLGLEWGLSQKCNVYACVRHRSAQPHTHQTCLQGDHTMWACYTKYNNYQKAVDSMPELWEHMGSSKVSHTSVCLCMLGTVLVSHTHVYTRPACQLPILCKHIMKNEKILNKLLEAWQSSGITWARVGSVTKV